MRRPAVLIAFIMAAAILVTDSITGYTSDYLEGLEGNNAAVTGRVVSIVKKMMNISSCSFRMSV